MRRMLSGFLATAMVASVCATMVSAATAASASVQLTADASVKPADYTTTGVIVGGNWTGKLNIGNVEIILKDGGSVLGRIDVSLDKDFDVTGTATDGTGKIVFSAATLDKAKIVNALDGKTFSDVEIGGAYYHGKLVKSSADTIAVRFDDKVSVPGLDGASLTMDVSLKDVATTATVDASVPTLSASGATITAPTVTGTGTAGDVKEDVDKEADGDLTNVRVADVVLAYGDGTPIPMTENPTGVNNDLNTAGGVQSGKTVWFQLRDDGPIAKLGDDSYWKLKVTKSKNGKYVSSIDDTTKIFNSPLYDANTGKAVQGTGDGKRHRYIKVGLKELYTDDEYKISLDFRISAMSAAERLGYADESEIKVNDFSFWMSNIVKDADNDWKVGIGGLMLNPLSNDWNEVTYYNEEKDVAFMKFFADSDVGKFYAKLSTKWEHEDYRSYFNDQDSFFFQFTGSPSISSTSRCDLQIYNPFVDEDGNETIDPATAVIYELIDGELVNVTDKFKYEEGENGDMAFTTKTRFLGSYIICEHEVEGLGAGDDTTPPTDVAPDDVAPTPVAPDGGDGGKTPPNTGRF